MTQNTRKRGLANYVAYQFDSMLIESGGDLDSLAFGLLHDRFRREIAVNGFPAVFMNTAHCSSDLTIFIKGKIFLEKIHQPAFALKHGEKMHKKSFLTVFALLPFRFDFLG